MNLRQELTPEQMPEPSQRLEQWQRAPILYNLHIKVDEDLNIDRAFIEPLREAIARNPQGKTTVFITGEPGAGKEILGGQLLDTLLNPVNPESVSPLPENLKIGYLSLGMALKIARSPELAQKYGEEPIPRPHGLYEPEDYEKASRILNKLIEEFYTSNPDDPHLLLAETVGFTYPTLDHGGSTIFDQVQKEKNDRTRNVFLLGVVAHQEVQKYAFEERMMAASHTSPQKLMDTFAKHDMHIIDREIKTPDDVTEFGVTRGTPEAGARVRRIINENISQYRRSLRRIDLSYSSDPTDDELFGGEERTKESRIAYFKYIAQDQLHVRPENILIAHNKPFRRSADLQKFPHYRELLYRYALVA